MTEGTPEPTNADLLAAIQELIVHVDQRVGAVEDSLAQLSDQVEEGFLLANTALVETRRDLAQVREEVLGVKVEMAGVERRQSRYAQALVQRHDRDPRAHGTAA